MLENTELCLSCNGQCMRSWKQPAVQNSSRSGPAYSKLMRYMSSMSGPDKENVVFAGGREKRGNSELSMRRSVLVNWDGACRCKRVRSICKGLQCVKVTAC